MRLSTAISVFFFRERSEVNLANLKLKLELENSNWAVISGLEDPSEAYRVFTR